MTVPTRHEPTAAPPPGRPPRAALPPLRPDAGERLAPALGAVVRLFCARFMPEVEPGPLGGDGEPAAPARPATGSGRAAPERPLVLGLSKHER